MEKIIPENSRSEVDKDGKLQVSVNKPRKDTISEEKVVELINKYRQGNLNEEKSALAYIFT